jgi:hypothetical protein
MDANLPDQIQTVRDRFNALIGRIAEAFAEVPEGEGLAEIDALFVRERQRPVDAPR